MSIRQINHPLKIGQLRWLPPQTKALTGTKSVGYQPTKTRYKNCCWEQWFGGNGSYLGKSSLSDTKGFGPLRCGFPIELAWDWSELHFEHPLYQVFI